MTVDNSNDRVLFVDDEPSVLEAIKRSLHQKAQVQTASSGAEGLRLLTDTGPFALIISDMRMPGMSGAQFLAKAREHAPDTVRMILSGQSDFQATLAAVNEGHIYRFLCKPCPADKLLEAIRDGLRQYHLLTAEKVLLEQTLSGSIKMLVELLGMLSPSASNRAARLQKYVLELAAALGLPIAWQWSTSAYVSQIGCVMLPKDLLEKVDAGEVLQGEDKRLYESHPRIASKLVASIPRLEDVAAIVTAQFGPTEFAAKAKDITAWSLRDIGQLLLRSALEYDQLRLRRTPMDATVKALRAIQIGLPESVITAFLNLKSAYQAYAVREIRLKELLPGMILEEDLVSLKGIRLVSAGHEVTRSLIIKLASFAEGAGVTEPFRARVPT